MLAGMKGGSNAMESLYGLFGAIVLLQTVLALVILLTKHSRT